MAKTGRAGVRTSVPERDAKRINTSHITRRMAWVMPANGGRPARTLCTVAVWIALIALLLTPLGSAFVPLGALNPAINLAIATAKALLVAWFFMHLRSAHAMLRITAAAGVFWLAILIGLSMTDFVVRYQDTQNATFAGCRKCRMFLCNLHLAAATVLRALTAASTRRCRIVATTPTLARFSMGRDATRCGLSCRASAPAPRGRGPCSARRYNGCRGGRGILGGAR